MKTRAVRLGAGAVVVAAFLTRSAGANAPAGRYTYAATSVTVVDTKTKLTWQRAAAGAMPVAAARTYCASAVVSTALGGTGWRLPTIKELQTLVDYSQATSPLIDTNAFPSFLSEQNLDFLSSTQPGGVPSQTAAWIIPFNNGTTETVQFPQFPDITFNVLCVR